MLRRLASLAFYIFLQCIIHIINPIPSCSAFIIPSRRACPEQYCTKKYKRNLLQSSSTNSKYDPEKDPKFQQRSKSWIVLVDDEESIRLAVGKYLYESGYAVTACADAEALLELLTSASSGGMLQNHMPTKLPSVIVLDIRMPGKGRDGMELFDLLKNPESAQVVVTRPDSDLDFVSNQWRRIAVVLLTAKSLTQDRIEGYKRGADVYLPKPFAPEELLSIVDNLIRRVDDLGSGGNVNGNGEKKATLRDVKSDIIDIKAKLKNTKERVKDNAKPKRLEQANAYAIVPRKKDERYDYQSEIEEIKSQVKVSDAETSILLLLSEGNTNGEIAQAMGFTIVKVGKIISNMYAKTFTKTRTELVRWAIKMGYVSANR
jgi:DNA-binding NarL/FixJ family response regulator